jgi:hypothetical protein
MLTYEDFGIEVPMPPVKTPVITKEMVINEWDIKQRNEYYHTEAMAAVYGKFIHDGCPLDVARDRLLDAMIEPRKLEGQGRDAIVVTKDPSVTSEDVDKLFYELQLEQRRWQAQFNSLKHAAETEANNRETKRLSDDRKALVEYDLAMQTANAKLEECRKTKTIEMQNLKIRIPDHLMKTFNKVSELGKKK